MSIEKYNLGYNETLKKDIQKAHTKLNDIIKLSKSFLSFFHDKKELFETHIIEQKTLNDGKNK
jgi:hypothetical protein